MSHAPAQRTIAIDGLIKDYQGLRPLRLHHLVVHAGERVALSGCDATAAEVLVNIVNGAILPDQGEVYVFGRRTADIQDEREWFAWLDRFGIVTPRAVLLEASTLRQNLALPFTIDLDNLGDDVRAKTEVIAAEVGLETDRLDRPVSEVPAEGRMRAHLGRALATEPQVLLMEHPTATIPRAHAAGFAAVVKRVAEARRLTLLVLTEDEGFADVVATAHYKLRGATGALVNARGWRRWL